MRVEGFLWLRKAVRIVARGDLGVLVFGRFITVRRMYGRVTAARQRFKLGKTALVAGPATVFPGVSTGEVLASVGTDAVFTGLQLSADVVTALVAFAEQAPCIRPHLINRFAALGSDTQERFTKRDVTSGHLWNGQPAPMATVVDPSVCPEAARLMVDPFLLDVARGFLGYGPTRVRVNMFWSFAADFDDDQRRRFHQTIDYHYDIESYSFLYVNFYLTDTDRESGAHAMVKGSQRGKTISMLVGSARRSRAAVLERWGTGSELTIEGAAGFGFVQDSACYHRALPPVSRDRLFMQLRYS